MRKGSLCRLCVRGKRPMEGVLSATLLVHNVDVLCGGSFYGFDVGGLEFKGVFISTALGFFSEKNFVRELVRVDLQCGKRFVWWFFLRLCGSTT